MPLQWQKTEIPFAKGIDEKTAEPHVPSDALAYVRNGQFQEPGSIGKRRGYDELNQHDTSDTQRANGAKIHALKSEAVIVLEDRLHSWSEEQARSVNKDDVPNATIIDRITGETVAPGLNSQGVDLTYCGGYYIEAWYDGDVTIYTRWIDATTGARGPVQSHTGTLWLRLVQTDDRYAYMFYFDGTVYRLAQLDTNDTAPEFGSPISVGLPATPAINYNLDACASGSVVYVAYNGRPASNNIIVVKRYNNALGLTHTRNGATSYYYAVHGIGISTDGTYVDFAYDRFGSTITVLRLNEADLSLGFACVTSHVIQYVKHLTIGTATGSGPCVFVEYDDGATLRSRKLFAFGVTAGGSVSGYQNQTYHIGILSKPILQDAAWYLVAHNEEDYRAWLVEVPLLLAESPGAAQCRVACRIAWYQARGNNITNTAPPVSLPAVDKGENGATQYAVPVRLYESHYDTLHNEFGFDHFVLEFNNHRAFLAATVESTLTLSGGCATGYEGNRVYELGFHQVPFAVSSSGNTGGLLTAGAEYGWAFVYEWIDSQGMMHESEVYSETVDLDPTHTRITWTIRTLTLTERHDAQDTTQLVRVILYRTTANPGADAIYYYEMAADNDRTAQFVTLISGDAASKGQSDAGIIDDRQLYTTGGVLENAGPPCSLHQVAHGGRLWVVSGDDPNTIWFSKYHVHAEMPGFPLAFHVRVEPDGPITALASLDDKLIVFKRSSIYAIVGNGPTDTGQANDLSEPQLLSLRTGCLDPRTVVAIPSGLMFESESGIALLTRGLTVEHVGQSIAETTATVEITSAVHIEDEHEARFTGCIYNAENDTGYIFVFNYLVGQWSIWDGPLAADGSGRALVGGATCRYLDSPTHYIVDSDGHVLRQYAAKYYDNTTAELPGDYLLQIVTGWFHLAGLQGFQRVRRASLLGQYLAPNAVEVRIVYDYETDHSYTKTWAGADITALIAGSPREQLVIHPNRQRCQAIQFEIDIEAHGDGGDARGGMRLDGLALEVGGEGGIFRVALDERR